MKLAPGRSAEISERGNGLRAALGRPGRWRAGPPPTVGLGTEGRCVVVRGRESRPHGEGRAARPQRQDWKAIHGRIPARGSVRELHFAPPAHWRVRRLAAVALDTGKGHEIEDIGVGQALLIGLAAGLVGTAIFTVVELIEIKLTRRPPSTIPGDVGVRLMGRDVESNRELAQRLNPYVHWGHGTMLGAVRGLLDVAGLAFWPATIVFYIVLEAGDMLLYRALGIQPWPWQWSGASLVRDLVLKAVLAIAISAVYAAVKLVL